MRPARVFQRTTGHCQRRAQFCDTFATKSDFNLPAPSLADHVFSHTSPQLSSAKDAEIRKLRCIQVSPLLNAGAGFDTQREATKNVIELARDLWLSIAPAEDMATVHLMATSISAGYTPSPRVAALIGKRLADQLLRICGKNLL